MTVRDTAPAIEPEPTEEAAFEPTSPKSALWAVENLDLAVAVPTTRTVAPVARRE